MLTHTHVCPSSLRKAKVTRISCRLPSFHASDPWQIQIDNLCSRRWDNPDFAQIWLWWIGVSFRWDSLAELALPRRETSHKFNSDFLRMLRSQNFGRFKSQDKSCYSTMSFIQGSFSIYDALNSFDILIHQYSFPNYLDIHNVFASLLIRCLDKMWVFVCMVLVLSMLFIFK